MEFITYIGEGIAGLVFLVVGLRLYSLSLRSDEISDRLLSTSFLLWTLGYAAYDIPYLLFYRDAAEFPALFAFSSLFAFYLGSAALTLFNRTVFRSQERWALWLVSITFGCLILGVTGSIWVGDWAGESPLTNPWWWVTRVGSAIPLCWMSVEGLTQYVKARKRLRVGLCEPLVCNRYLLWGLAGSFWVLLELIDIVDYIAFESTGQPSATINVLLGWHEFIPGVLVGLVFFPPAIYRSWIEGDTREELVPE